MRIPSNFAAAGVRSRLLLLLLFVTDHFRTSLGTNDSPPEKPVPKLKTVHPSGHVLINRVSIQRRETSASIIDFKFNENRVRVLSESVDIPKESKGIIYWMNRDHRIQDNWALLYAQKLAIENKLALHVVYCRSEIVTDISFRQYKFMCTGLCNIEREFQTMNIDFHFLTGDSTKMLAHFVRNRTQGGIVVDFSPLRNDIKMINNLVLAIGSEVPVIQVDAHNVVPCWLMSDKQISNVLEMKNKMAEVFDTYFTEFPPVIRHPYTALPKPRRTDWIKSLSKLRMDSTVKCVPYYKSGYVPAMKALNYFLQFKLGSYSFRRLNPLVDGLSNLSPWLHFGHISAQRVLLEVLKLNRTHSPGVIAYKTEILIRRELHENFCYYNSEYDNIEGGPMWGRNTLRQHRNDTRDFLHTRDELEYSETRDFLWNACNNQMVTEGKTHRLLRPYWAKKILEFSKTPEEAIATANYLNNKYSLDGNDPAGYGEILWAIAGLFDEKKKRRKIFGRVRYIYASKLRENINSYAYINKYNGSYITIGGKKIDFFQKVLSE